MPLVQANKPPSPFKELRRFVSIKKRRSCG